MRIALVTNFCPHYRVKTYETLARQYDVDYYFFSAGDDWYWHQQNGVHVGNFHFEYLPGISIGKTRLTPSLLWKLFLGDYQAYIKCINGRFALPVTFMVSRLRRKPFILWTGIWMRLGTLSHKLFFPITRYIYRHADAIICYGDHVKRYLIQEGVSAERIFTAPHAVNNDAFQVEVSHDLKLGLLKELRIDPKKKIILYLGRLEEAKGLSDLLKGFASLARDDAILIMAGDGSYRQKLVEETQSLGITDKVRFVGHIRPEETINYYSLAYVYVLPSITTPTFKEPWGLVVNEAFNLGVPVIATDAVGAAAGGLVIDQYNGLVVGERNSFALSKALETILSDENLHHTFSQNAKSTVSHWDVDHMVMGFRAAIDYVMRNRR